MEAHRRRRDGIGNPQAARFSNSSQWVGAGVPEEDARGYETHVKEGRILITAQAPTAQLAQAARDAVERYGGKDVRAYDRREPSITT